jgi:periplasmic protein TonB
MNPKFILPASFAVTAHVFLLFGLPGRTPAIASAPPEDTPRLTGPEFKPEVIAIERPREDPGDTDPAPRRDSPGIPSIVEVPAVNPPVDAIPIPTIVPPDRTDPTGRIDAIPPDWERHGGPTGPRAVPAADLDRVPRARAQPAPVYPASLRNGGIEGKVVVEFLVDESGNAYDPVVVSATRREFEEPVLRAVARWKFEPGFKDGRRVRFRMSVPLVFRLDRE